VSDSITVRFHYGVYGAPERMPVGATLAELIRLHDWKSKDEPRWCYHYDQAVATLNATEVPREAWDRFVLKQGDCVRVEARPHMELDYSDCDI